MEPLFASSFELVEHSLEVSRLIVWAEGPPLGVASCSAVPDHMRALSSNPVDR